MKVKKQKKAIISKEEREFYKTGEAAIKEYLELKAQGYVFPVWNPNVKIVKNEEISPVFESGGAINETTINTYNINDKVDFNYGRADEREIKSGIISNKTAKDYVVSTGFSQVAVEPKDIIGLSKETEKKSHNKLFGFFEGGGEVFNDNLSIVNDKKFYRYYPYSKKPFEINYDGTNKYGYGIYFLDNNYYYKHKYPESRVMCIKPKVKTPLIFINHNEQIPCGEYSEALLNAMQFDGIKSRDEFNKKMVENGFDSLVVVEPRGVYLLFLYNDPSLYEVIEDVDTMFSRGGNIDAEDELKRVRINSIKETIKLFNDLNYQQAYYLYDNFNKKYNENSFSMWLPEDENKKHLVKSKYIDEDWILNKNVPMNTDNRYSLTEKGKNFFNEAAREIRKGLGIGTKYESGGGMTNKSLNDLFVVLDSKQNQPIFTVGDNDKIVIKTWDVKSKAEKEFDTKSSYTLNTIRANELINFNKKAYYDLLAQIGEKMESGGQVIPYTFDDFKKEMPDIQSPYVGESEILYKPKFDSYSGKTMYFKHGRRGSNKIGLADAYSHYIYQKYQIRWKELPTEEKKRLLGEKHYLYQYAKGGKVTNEKINQFKNSPAYNLTISLLKERNIDYTLLSDSQMYEGYVRLFNEIFNKKYVKGGKLDNDSEINTIAEIANLAYINDVTAHDSTFEEYSKKVIELGGNYHESDIRGAYETMKSTGYKKGGDIYAKGGSITKSENFKKWFGGSKVLDKDGNPLIMWHGGSFNSEQGIFKGVGWFTSIKYGAKYYAKQNNGSLTGVFLSIKKPYYSGHVGKKYVETNQAVIDALKHKGKYDGVIDLDKNGNIIDAIVFDSKSIKLADGSNTTFNIKNPDIRFNEGGELIKNDDDCYMTNLDAWWYNLPEDNRKYLFEDEHDSWWDVRESDDIWDGLSIDRKKEIKKAIIDTGNETKVKYALNLLNSDRYGIKLAKGGGLDKRALKELKLLGFSDEQIKFAEIFDKEREKFGDIVKIKDVPNIKSGDSLGYIYRHEDDRLGDIGTGKIIFSEQWGEWGMNAYPFDMNKRQIQDNINNPEFELKNIKNDEYKWTLFHLKK